MNFFFLHSILGLKMQKYELNFQPSVCGAFLNGLDGSLTKVIYCDHAVNTRLVSDSD
jgi:hypothetical protein